MKLRRRTIDQAGEARSPTIEALRAVAALAVLEGHVFGAARGYGVGAYVTVFDRVLLGGGFGVYLFFALTGYLLYRPFVEHDFGDRRPLRMARYAANRAFRILPLYYVVLAAYLLVDGSAGSGTSWLRYGLFLENFAPHVAPIDGPMWSLVVEVQFYVLLPFLALGVARLARGSIGRAAGVVGALGARALLVRLATVTLPSVVDVHWSDSLPSTFVFFTGGLLLALVDVAWRERRAGDHRPAPPGWPASRGRPSWLVKPLGWSDTWILAALGLFLVVCWDYAADPLLVAAGFLLLGAVVLPLERGVLVGALAWRPLALLGLCSYSLYLWHFPIVTALARSSWLPHGYLVQLAVAVPVCVAVAGASYLVVESPFLRLRRSWGAARRWVPALASS